MKRQISQQDLDYLGSLVICDALHSKTTGKRVAFLVTGIFRVEESPDMPDGSPGGCRVFCAIPNVHHLDVEEPLETVLQEIAWVKDKPSGILAVHGTVPPA